MRLLFIRHGDPDYAKDSLTEKGCREAAALAEYMAGETVTEFYCSPLGRARKTAEYTLERTGRTAEIKEWLMEFPAQLDISKSSFLQKAFPNTRKDEEGNFCLRHPWDMLPEYWMNDPAYLDRDAWRQTEVARHSDMAEVYDRVCAGLDGLLAEHGYRREGNLYRTEEGNSDTLAFFCHFGITAVFLSHLWNVSPFIPMQMLTTLTTSVTEIYTEERIKGVCSFRTCRIGDLTHLYIAKEPPSFAARFCERFENTEQRH